MGVVVWLPCQCLGASANDKLLLSFSVKRFVRSVVVSFSVATYCTACVTVCVHMSLSPEVTGKKNIHLLSLGACVCLCMCQFGITKATNSNVICTYVCVLRVCTHTALLSLASTWCREALTH